MSFCCAPRWSKPKPIYAKYLFILAQTLHVAPTAARSNTPLPEEEEVENQLFTGSQASVRGVWSVQRAARMIVNRKHIPLGQHSIQLHTTNFNWQTSCTNPHHAAPPRTTQWEREDQRSIIHISVPLLGACNQYVTPRSTHLWAHRVCTYIPDQHQARDLKVVRVSIIDNR